MTVQAPTDGTVGKALGILDCVAEQGRPVRFSEILAKSRYPKATLYRLLQTLTNQGMLAYDEDRQTYSMGLRLVRLAHCAWRMSSLAPIAGPMLDRLAAKVDETIHLAQMDSGHVVFVDKRRTSDRFETLAQAGRIAPGHCTGVGKAMLAFLSPTRLELAMQQQTFFKFTPNTHETPESLAADLDVIREEGVAYDREEHEVGIISIAAPILTPGERVLGAVSIASSTSRHTLESLTAFRPALLRTADEIGAEAAAWQFPQTI